MGGMSNFQLNMELVSEATRELGGGDQSAVVEYLAGNGP